MQEVLWSIQGSYPVIWSLPLTNVKWHSDSWPVTVTSKPIRIFSNFMTVKPSLTFIELRVVSMEHLQRMWNAIRERLPLRTPGSAPLLGTCLCSNCWLYSNFHLEYPSVLSRFCCALPLYIITLVTAGILVTIILKLLCTNINYRCYRFTTTPFFLKLSFSQNTYYSE